MGLAVAGFVAMLGKSYPHSDISRFAAQLTYIATVFAFYTHVYLGALVEVAMTPEDQWQKGYLSRQRKVAAIRRWLCRR